VALLHPLQHGSAQAQLDLLGLKLRDSLVRTRVNLINTVRFTLKSLGHAVANPSSERFTKVILTAVPAECLPVVQPVLAVLTLITDQIKPWNATWWRAANAIIPSPSGSSKSPAWGRSPHSVLC